MMKERVWPRLFQAGCKTGPYAIEAEMIQCFAWSGGVKKVCGPRFALLARHEYSRQSFRSSFRLPDIACKSLPN